MQAKKNIVCIFAHPDDEAMGPSGTIAKWAKKNNVFLICVTDGENKSADTRSTFSVRGKEMQNSAKILGVKKVYFLGYPDGELRNNIYHDVAKDIKKILDHLKPSVILTYELNGVSGHIDHIFVSMVTSYLFQKLEYIKKIYYYTESKLVSNFMSNRYFIYFPEGCDKEEVDCIEDVSETFAIKIDAVRQHLSQKKDVDLIIRKLNLLPKEEYFYVREKNLKNVIKNRTKLAGDLTKALLHKFKKGRMD